MECESLSFGQKFGLMILQDFAVRQFYVTLPKANSKLAPDNRPRAPKGKDRFPKHHFFRGSLEDHPT